MNVQRPRTECGEVGFCVRAVGWSGMGCSAGPSDEPEVTDEKRGFGVFSKCDVFSGGWVWRPSSWQAKSNWLKVRWVAYRHYLVHTERSLRQNLKPKYDCYHVATSQDALERFRVLSIDA